MPFKTARVFCWLLISTLAVLCSAQEQSRVIPLSAASRLQHKQFMDRENLLLHSWNIAASTFDAITTRQGTNGARINELNPFGRVFVNRGWAGQGVFSYGFGVGGTLLLSYVLHRSGHHRCERIIPAFNATASTAAGVWNVKH